MRESETNSRIRTWCREQGVFWQRFEDSVQRGIPDGYLGLGSFTHSWVELKATSGAERPVYRPGQLAWAATAAKGQQRCSTLASGADGLFRVYDTAAVALAVAHERDWPAPLITSFQLHEALLGCLGLRQLPGGRTR